MQGSVAVICLVLFACVACIVADAAEAGSFQQIAGFEQKTRKNSSRSVKEFENAESGSRSVSAAVQSVQGAGGQALKNANQELLNAKSSSRRNSGRSETQQESSITETKEFVKNKGFSGTSNGGSFFPESSGTPNVGEISSATRKPKLSSATRTNTRQSQIGANNAKKAIVGGTKRNKSGTKQGSTNNSGLLGILGGLNKLLLPSRNSKQKMGSSGRQYPESRLVREETTAVIQNVPSKSNELANQKSKLPPAQNASNNQNNGADNNPLKENKESPNRKNTNVQITNGTDQINKTREKSSKVGLKGNQIMRIIIHHPGAGRNQDGEYFRNTKEAAQRTKSSKSKESSASASEQVGSRVDSASISASKQRELDAAQRAKVSQTRDRTEIILTQQIAAKKKKSESETYSSKDINSQDSTAKNVVSDS